jgi:glycosyltransferase involved in cell wall biosynthesis
MSETPFVTVIAPCRNEVDYIEDTIKTILNNEYPADKLEMLVVDGMSNDGTREVVKEISKKDNRVKLVDNPNKIVPTAMNIGIKSAKGECIVRIDCHTKFAKNYISKCIEVKQRTQADNVGGYCNTLQGSDTKTAKAIAAATSCKFGVGNSAFRLTDRSVEQEVDTVPFGTYKKSIFDEIGLYDKRLVRNQDIELNSRIRKAGGKIIISPEIKLSYYNRATFKGLWQQAFNNGLWNPYTIWLVGSGLSLRHFIPMFFVLGLLILGIGCVLYLPVLFLLIPYLVIYFSAALYFALKVAKSQKVNPLLVLFSFLVLHTAYGLGSLWAILTIPFKFPNRKKKFVGDALADRRK